MRSREIKRRAGILIRKRQKLHFKFPSILKVRRAKEYFFRACVIAAIFLILGGAWSLLRPGTKVRANADTVAAFRVPHRSIGMLRVYAAENAISFPELFAVFNAENNFFPDKHASYDLSALERLYVSNFNKLLRQYNSRSLAPYTAMFENLFSEIEAFPVPSDWCEFGDSIMFGDSWSAEHKGTAILDRENIRGRVPIVSMTSGTVRDTGWDNQHGYFVGIVTENGTYYLYAHLDSLAPSIAAGQSIVAGQHLGQMGNSGGGRNNRSLPVHLHIAISPNVSFTRGNFWINPYPLLRYIENPTVF